MFNCDPTLGKRQDGDVNCLGPQATPVITDVVNGARWAKTDGQGDSFVHRTRRAQQSSGGGHLLRFDGHRQPAIQRRDDALQESKIG